MAVTTLPRKTKPGKTQVKYRDFDIAFKAHPVTGKLVIKKDRDSIKQALKYLVLTNTYERVFKPTLGTNVRAKLFENFDRFIESDIQYTIEVAIKEFEPRVSIVGQDLGVFVSAKPDTNTLIVTIKYVDIATMQSEYINVNLDRIR
jgi:phage baseplate assembly protein W